MKSQTIKSYRDLRFWQTSFQVTKAILTLSRSLDNDFVIRICLTQLIRASSSVGANVAEGFGRYKGREYCRFLRIALGSANETEYWLIILKEMCKGRERKIDEIIELNRETIGMLVASLKTLESKR